MARRPLARLWYARGMAGIIWGCIAPHGLALIPELSDDADGAMATRAAMEELARRCESRRPDVLVVATPHGTRVEGAFAIAGAADAIGALHWNGRTIELRVPLDRELSDAISERARQRGLPVALTSWGGNRRDGSLAVLDWGAAVPLSFLGNARHRAGASDVFAPQPRHTQALPVVLVAPSRTLSRRSMLEFGAAVADAAAASGRRVAFVASCDWAHTHRADGPYGFHPAAAEVDRAVVEAVRANRLERLLELPEEQAEAAAIDGLWQALMLQGAAGDAWSCELLSYQAPTYFGMLVAEYS